MQLLVPLVSAFRYEGDKTNMTLAKSEARILHGKISEKACGDEEIIRILTTRSKAQLNATLNHYNDEFGNAITKVISKPKQASLYLIYLAFRPHITCMDSQDLKWDPKDEYLKLLRATIKCLTSPERYYEKTLRLAIKGLGTDENALTRVIVTQAEANMQRIKEEYYKRNSVSLEEAILGDTSGDYKKVLLALIRDTKEEE